MATETNTSKASGALSMKLLVDTKEQRVLYAEAGMDVVDFLFSLHTLPSARSSRTPWLAPSASCIAASRRTCCWRRPVASASATSSSCRPRNFTGLPCQLPHCNGKMTLPVKHVVSSSSTTGSTGGEAAAHAPSAVAGSGFVQGLVTYAIMDDLKVATMSTITLVKSGVTSIKQLQEKTVQIGYTEGLAMLKASLQSKTVLTDVFLGKKRKKWSFVLVVLCCGFYLLACLIIQNFRAQFGGQDRTAEEKEVTMTTKTNIWK